MNYRFPKDQSHFPEDKKYQPGPNNGNIQNNNVPLRFPYRQQMQRPTQHDDCFVPNNFVVPQVASGTKRSSVGLLPTPKLIPTISVPLLDLKSQLADENFRSRANGLTHHGGGSVCEVVDMDISDEDDCDTSIETVAFVNCKSPMGETIVNEAPVELAANDNDCSTIKEVDMKTDGPEEENQENDVPYSPSQLFMPQECAAVDLILRSPAKEDIKESIRSWLERASREGLAEKVCDDQFCYNFYGRTLVRNPRIIPQRLVQGCMFLDDPRHEKVIGRFRQKLQAIVMRVWVQRYRNVYGEDEILQELGKVVIRQGHPLLWQRLILFYEKPSVHFPVLTKVAQLTWTLAEILGITGPEIPRVIPLQPCVNVPVTDPRLAKSRGPRRNPCVPELKLIPPYAKTSRSRVRAYPQQSESSPYIDLDTIPLTPSKRLRDDSTCAITTTSPVKGSPHTPSSTPPGSGVSGQLNPNQKNGF